MKRSLFAGQQIAFILRQAEGNICLGRLVARSPRMEATCRWTPMLCSSTAR